MNNELAANDAFKRLLSLFSGLGADIEDSEQRAQLAAYCAGIKIVRDMLDSAIRCTALNLFENISMQEIENDFESCQIDFDGENVRISEYSADSIGRAVYKWLFPTQSISLCSNGVDWEYIDTLGFSFFDIEEKKYRWDMIESR